MRAKEAAGALSSAPTDARLDESLGLDAHPQQMGGPTTAREKAVARQLAALELERTKTLMRLESAESRREPLEAAAIRRQLQAILERMDLVRSMV